jgi:HSP20 family protein
MNLCLCNGIIFSIWQGIKLTVMANLTRRNAADPWRDFFDLDLFGNRLGQARSSLPAVNIAEDEQNYIVDVVAPGFSKEDFKINVEDDMLTISAESRHEDQEGGRGKEYTRREYSYSSFTRSFRLPDNAKDDAIGAKYSDGVLHINIPKSEEQQKATKQVNIE